MTFDQWLRSEKRGVVDEWQVKLAREAWHASATELCRQLFELEPQIQAYRELLRVESGLKGKEYEDDEKTVLAYIVAMLRSALEDNKCPSS